MKKIAVVMGALFVMTGCEKKPADAPKEGDKAAEGAKAEGATGAASCDAYIKGMEACIAKMPEAAQAPAKDGMKQAQDAWKAITDKGALETACKTALDAAKQGMGAACPDVKWE
jgi:hypothetical protein